MRTFEAREELAAPLAVAWQRMAAVEAWPEWLPTMRSVDALQPGPLALGARYRVRQPRLPAAVWAVTQLEPGTSFTWESRSPGVVTTGEHALTPRGPDACSVHLRLTLRGPLATPTAWLAGRMIREYVALEARSLAGSLEEGGPTAPSDTHRIGR